MYAPVDDPVVLHMTSTEVSGHVTYVEGQGSPLQITAIPERRVGVENVTAVNTS